MVDVLSPVRKLNFEPDNLWENEGVSLSSKQLKTSKPSHTTKVLKDRVPNHMIADKSPNIKRKAFTPQAAFTGRGLAA